jgi:hypothetical protein
MTQSIEQSVSAALAAKVQAFASMLASDDASTIQRAAQELLGQDQQGDVQGYALGEAAGSDATPAASRLGEQIKQELPAPLVDKLREFGSTLSTDERSELRSVRQAMQGEVQGYNFGGVVRDHRDAGGWGGTVRDHRGQPNDNITPLTVGLGVLLLVGEIAIFL